jgi:hypothetical protein
MNKKNDADMKKKTKIGSELKFATLEIFISEYVDKKHNSSY